MTSNIGSDIIQERFEHLNEANKLETIENTKNEVFNLLKKSVRPEFLNRIDETIMFTPLTQKDITSIVRMQFNRLVQRLAAMDIKIEITENAVNELARLGYNPQFGARPVKRIIQKELLNELSKKLLSGDVVKDSKIVVDVENEQIVFRN
jgi:ATP-dependent Clp protease ATP-binding subunit ClpB